MGRKAKATAKEEAKVGDMYKAPTSPSEPATAPPPAGMAGSPMEIVFSFDTTGSMYSLLDEVRKNLSDLIRRLQDDIPNIRIGVIAHGDYCDEGNRYVVKMIDFTRETDKLIHFVNHVEATGGGDSDECYELALKTARTQFSWSLGTQRSLVVIGDASPHGTDYYYYKNHTTIDWKKEADSLFAMGVHIYGVSCGGHEDFYKELAKKTDGTFLELRDFTNIFDMICAICYKEQGAEHFYAFEQEVRDREKRMLNTDLDGLLKTLRKSASTASTMSLKDSDPATPRATLKRAAPTATVAPTPVKKARVAPSKVSKRKTVKFIKPKVKKILKKTSVKKAKVAKTPAAASTKVVKKATRVSAAGRPVKQRRETAKMSDVLLKDGTWSRWATLIAPDENLLADLPRTIGPGYRNPYAFCCDGDVPAIYEVAVSTPGSTKKHVVYVRRLLHRRGLLDTALFSYLKYKDAQIDNLINKKCTLYIRRALITSANADVRMATAIRELRQKFDYAWCKNGYGRTYKRALTKNGILISDSKY